MEQQSNTKRIAARLALITKVGSGIKKWAKFAKQSKDRYFRLRQLVTTQASYLNQLKTINVKIQNPLKQSGAINEQEQKQMFPNIQGMINLSQLMYTDMNKLLQKFCRKETLIAPKMITFSKFFILYSDFFKNYNTTQNKLKALVQNNQTVQNIQKELANPPQIQTIFNLVSKPFYRPFKYHLLLKQYLKQTSPKHPDYKNLEIAVQQYHKVNLRNNQFMQHKEKDNMLMNLDNLFRDVISSEARYYISQCQAFIFELKVKCYILSDVIIISRKDGAIQVEYARIQINQSSFIFSLPDGIYMKNRLILCGKKISIHLMFQQASQRDRFLTYFNQILPQIYKNKQELRASRRSTMMSVSYRQSDYTVQEPIYSRDSMIQLQAMLPQPPRIIVLGPIKRVYSSRSTKIYYLVKFQLPFPSDYNQILYVDQDQMNIIDKISRNVYSKERDFIEAPCLDQLLKLMQSGNQIRNFQYKTVYFTLILNNIFRHPKISQRTDIFTHKLDVTLGLWLEMKYPTPFCQCKNCFQGKIVSTIQSYNIEAKERFISRQLPMTFYCPFRTFRVQDTILTMTSSQVKQIQLAADRIFWIKCSRGNLEYRLLDNCPVDIGQSKLVVFHLCCGIETRKYQRQVRRQDRVGQIKFALSREHGIDLVQYQMCMQINKITYLLGDDEVLYKLLSNEMPPQQGITGFFKSAFGTKQDTTIRIYLKRVWWLITQQSQLSHTKKNEMKMNLFIEQLGYRLKNQQMQLNVKDTITFYACQLIYSGIQKPTEVNEAILQCLVPSKKWKLLTSKLKQEMLGVVRDKFKKLIQSTFSGLKDSNLKKSVFDYLIKYLKNKPIWGVYIFQGQYVYQNKTIPVRIGFDLTNFVIKQPQKVTTIYQEKIQKIRDKLIVSSWQLRINEEERQYIVTGNSFVQMLQLLDMYIHYSKIFLQPLPS